MTYYLLKSEPNDYSIHDLEKDKKTVWDGVKNNLALKHLKEIRKGNLCFIYHTGKERQITGLAEAVSDAYLENPDIKNSYVVDIKFLNTYNKPLTLKEFKEDKRFEGFDLLRLSRLSVMPVPESYLKYILDHLS
jgi:predicted RNA-binding protein with PUA-like domain